MIKIQIKPLSVNQCWQGKRFKTKTYKDYEFLLLGIMPDMPIPIPPLRVEYEFGVSNMAADIDNPVKPLQDILQKRYGFNDKDIVEAVIRKVKTPKNQEYIAYSLVHHGTV